MGIPVLRISDGNGNIIAIPAIKGDGNVPEITNYSNTYGTQTVLRYSDGVQIIYGKTKVGVTSYTMIVSYSADYYLEKSVSFSRYGTFEKQFTSIDDYCCFYGNDTLKSGLNAQITGISNTGITNFSEINLATTSASEMNGYMHYTVIGRWK